MESVETLGIQGTAALKFMRMWTSSTTTTFVLNRIKDGIATRPNYQGNYQGNPQGNNFNNFNQPPLRELIFGQAKIMESLSRKLSSNDRILENMSNKMDNLSPAIKN